MSLTELYADSIDRVDWNKSDGLVPAVVQDASSLRVLMLGYMNRESFEKTINTGKATFYSRSRQQLWQKGETSGNTLDVEHIEIDCDADTILVFATPHGPTCHLMTTSCFDNHDDDHEKHSTPGSSHLSGIAFLQHLQEVIESRKNASADSSYTARLFASGTAKVAQKVGEEGVEVALAALQAAMTSKDGQKVEAETEFLGECADLVYHLMVVLADRGYELADVAAVLRQRHQT